MFLQYYVNELGDRVYTMKSELPGHLRSTPQAERGRDQRCPESLLCNTSIKKKVSPGGQPTSSAHPARFSPDDKYSRHRISIKKRFGLLLTQQPRPLL